jgi:hypothetical protein
MAQTMGPDEGSALVAVERANGGELAPIAQVLWTRSQWSRDDADPATFAASVTLLVEARLIEYVEDQLGLTPAGRKLLRRSGMPNDPRHIERVTELLADIEGVDLEITLIAPTALDVRLAMSDEEQIEASPDGFGNPFIGEDVSETERGTMFGTVWLTGVPGGDSDSVAGWDDRPGHDSDIDSNSNSKSDSKSESAT